MNVSGEGTVMISARCRATREANIGDRYKHGCCTRSAYAARIAGDIPLALRDLQVQVHAYKNTTFGNANVAE